MAVADKSQHSVRQVTGSVSREILIIEYLRKSLPRLDPGGHGFGLMTRDFPMNVSPLESRS